MQDPQIDVYGNSSRDMSNTSLYIMYAYTFHELHV